MICPKFEYKCFLSEFGREPVFCSPIWNVIKTKKMREVHGVSDMNINYWQKCLPDTIVNTIMMVFTQTIIKLII